MLGGKAQLAMTASNWPEAIALFEQALEKLTEHPATLSPINSGEEPDEEYEVSGDRSSAPPGSTEHQAVAARAAAVAAADERWFRVAMPALLRAGPSLSSRALERLEVGGVVKSFGLEIAYEGRQRLQVAGHVYGRGWCSVVTSDGEPILREVQDGGSVSPRAKALVAVSSPPVEASTPDRAASPQSDARAVTPERAVAMAEEPVVDQVVEEPPLEAEESQEAAWRAEAVRRELAQATAKLQREEAAAEALELAEKAAASVRIAELRVYKEKAQKLEAAKSSARSPAARSGTPPRSDAAARRVAEVEASLSATRPRNRWGPDDNRNASINATGAVGGDEVAKPQPARQNNAAAQRRVGGWRQEAMRRERAMLGSNRRRRSAQQQRVAAAPERSAGNGDVR